jgi:hypothetical protein
VSERTFYCCFYGLWLYHQNFLCLILWFISSFVISKFHGHSRRKSQGITNIYHFCYELFNNIIDIHLNELDDRFTETSTELLLCVACLNPSDSFSTFNKKKLIRLALFYPNKFSIMDLMVLGDMKVYVLSTTPYYNFFHFKNIFKLILFDMS